MPDGSRDPICLTIWRVSLLPPWQPLVACGMACGPEVQSLRGFPAGPWPVSHLCTGQPLFPLSGRFWCVPGSLFELPPLPLSPPSPYPPGQLRAPFLSILCNPNHLLTIPQHSIASSLSFLYFSPSSFQSAIFKSHKPARTSCSRQSFEFLKAVPRFLKKCVT